MSKSFASIIVLGLTKAPGNTVLVQLSQKVTQSATGHLATDRIAEEEHSIDESIDHVRDLVIVRKSNESIEELQKRLNNNPDARIVEYTSNAPILSCKEKFQYEHARESSHDPETFVSEWYDEIANVQWDDERGCYVRYAYSSAGGDDTHLNQVNEIVAYDGDACVLDEI